MRPRFRAMLLLLGCQATASVMAADNGRLSLLNNPFTLPAWLPELKNREVLRADAIAGAESDPAAGTGRARTDRDHGVRDRADGRGKRGAAGLG